MKELATAGSAAGILRIAIHQFGIGAVLGALLGILFAKLYQPAVHIDIPDHLRPDVGLPPRPPDAPHWARYR